MRHHDAVTLKCGVLVHIWVIQVAAASLDFLRAHNITRVVNCSAVDIDNHFENQPLGDDTESKLIQYMSFYSDDADPETDDPGKQRRGLVVIAISCFGNSERPILSHHGESTKLM